LQSNSRSRQSDLLIAAALNCLYSNVIRLRFPAQTSRILQPATARRKLGQEFNRIFKFNVAFGPPLLIDLHGWQEADECGCRSLLLRTRQQAVKG
jgi:hypothetical protein